MTVEQQKDALGGAYGLAYKILHDLEIARASAQGVREEVGGLLDSFCMDGCCFLGANDAGYDEIGRNGKALLETLHNLSGDVLLLIKKVEGVKGALQGMGV